MRRRDVRVGMEVEHQPSGEYLGRVVSYGGGVTMRVMVDGEGNHPRLATIYEVRPAPKGGAS